MSNNARSPLLIGGLSCAGVAVLLFAGYILLPFIIFLIPLPNETTVEIDEGETGVVAINLPPSEGAIIVSFDEARAALSPAIDDAHSAFSKDGRITVTFPDCPFPRGCRVVLNLADVPPGDAGAQIVLSYPERDSEYLDEIELEYSTDS